MVEADLFACEFLAGQQAVAGEFQRVGMAEKPHAVGVAVAPDEGGVVGGEGVEDVAAADVAAVEDQFGALPGQKFSRRLERFGAAQGIADEPDPHGGDILGMDLATDRDLEILAANFPDRILPILLAPFHPASRDAPNRCRMGVGRVYSSRHGKPITTLRFVARRGVLGRTLPGRGGLMGAEPFDDG